MWVTWIFLLQNIWCVKSRKIKWCWIFILLVIFYKDSRTENFGEIFKEVANNFLDYLFISPGILQGLFEQIKTYHRSDRRQFFVWNVWHYSCAEGDKKDKVGPYEILLCFRKKDPKIFMFDFEWYGFWTHFSYLQCWSWLY